MINFFAESRLRVTAAVDGNLCRILGEAVNLLVREKHEKVRFWEAADPLQQPECYYAIALLKCEMAMLERWWMKLNRLVENQRQSSEFWQAALFPQFRLPSEARRTLEFVEKEVA